MPTIDVNPERPTLTERVEEGITNFLTDTFGPDAAVAEGFQDSREQPEAHWKARALLVAEDPPCSGIWEIDCEIQGVSASDASRRVLAGLFTNSTGFGAVLRGYLTPAGVAMPGGPGAVEFPDRFEKTTTGGVRSFTFPFTLFASALEVAEAA